MFKVVQKKKLAENTYLMEVEAPDIAKKARPGQFVILRIDEKGERVPMTIADCSKKTITIVFLEVGKTTKNLAKLRKNDCLLNLAGPLGNPSEIKQYGKVCLVGGGLGIAAIYPIVDSLKKNGNDVICIIGAKNKKYLFWEDKLKGVSQKIIVCTDDGSKGKKGFVSDALKSLIEDEKIDRVVAIGPTIMMKMVANVTRDRIRTIVSLNPIMVDGVGMCGGCRVTVDDKIKFACVDGPEFDAHLVDFDELMNRNSTYADEEKCNCKNGNQNA